jgi:beta-phosphoglucomutase-like phosphatase (HAD superfamily)
LSATPIPVFFTTDFYQAYVAGKPRLDGALATLERLGVPHADFACCRICHCETGADRSAIEEGSFDAFPDAVRFAVALHDAGFRLALASSSKNAEAMLQRLPLPSGESLLSIFDADLSGADVPRGKPDPAIFLRAADALGIAPTDCLVVEDAPPV